MDNLLESMKKFHFNPEIYDESDDSIASQLPKSE